MDDVDQRQEPYILCGVVDNPQCVKAVQFILSYPLSLLAWRVDMHEIAVCSGLAAAYQLGAEYVT